MKKLLALIMALCLLFTLAACGGGETTDSGDNSDGGNTVNLADFEGVWKISQGDVEIVKISGSTVTAYTAEGYVISTFPVVATDKGAVLKMGAYGDVTLEDATALTVTAEPTVSAQPDVLGEWEYVFGEVPADTVLSFANDGNFTQTGTNADFGPYTLENMVLSIVPTKELFGAISYKLYAGGKVMVNEGDFKRIFVKKDADDSAKAVAYQHALILGDWKATDDAAFTVEFTKEGKILVSGAEMGIWYPTATGATVEYSDGNSDTLNYTDGQFTLNYYGKTFSK